MDIVHRLESQKAPFTCRLHTVSHRRQKYIKSFSLYVRNDSIYPSHSIAFEIRRKIRQNFTSTTSLIRNVVVDLSLRFLDKYHSENRNTPYHIARRLELPIVTLFDVRRLISNT